MSGERRLQVVIVRVLIVVSCRVSAVVCPVLVGRDAELKQLTDLLSQAADGAARMVVLAGEAGVGKSRLAREVTDLARARGFAVFAGRSPESALPVPFRPVTEALMRAARDGLSADGPQIADYRPSLGALVPEWRQPGDDGAEVSEMIVCEGVLRLVSTAGEAGALVVL